jgi:hypothetical protein
MVENKFIEVNNENPNEHWKFIECNQVVAVDLGCGRWEKKEYRDPSWPTTPEYLIQKGANVVYAFDIDNNEIMWYNENVSNKMNVVAINQGIHSVDDIRNILQKFKPKTIKCDIEGGEIHLINLADEIFKMVDEYYIETHNQELYLQCINKLLNCNYTIVEQIDLIHTNGACKVIFGKK